VIAETRVAMVKSDHESDAALVFGYTTTRGGAPDSAV
jgi:hypothetical protein